MKVSCGVSLGEYLDKYTILFIKLGKIQDFNKKEEITREIADYDKDIIVNNDYFVKKLYDINLKSWINNDVRKLKIKEKIFDKEFIDMCVLESQLNDERYLIKKEIDLLNNSYYKEQKNYL